MLVVWSCSNFVYTFCAAFRWFLAWHFVFFFKQKTAYEIGLGIPAEPLFRSGVQLLRLSLATPSRWTPLALSVFLHCVVRSEERRVGKECRSWLSPDHEKINTLCVDCIPPPATNDDQYLNSKGRVC